MSLSPISLIAWSHLIRAHSPLTSFNGYLRRRSPETSSRTAAPLAQCEPRLIGLSKLGSWPIQTPLATSAVTVQPPAHWVQMLLRIATLAPAVGGGPAAAFLTPPSGRVPSPANPPATSPERSLNPRQASPHSVPLTNAR